MKTRNGFVSNSSSSSFLINIDKLTLEQIEMIKNHPAEGYEKWELREVKGLLCTTSMDNFDLKEYVLTKVGVEENDIIYL